MSQGQPALVGCTRGALRTRIQSIPSTSAASWAADMRTDPFISFGNETGPPRASWRKGTVPCRPTNDLDAVGALGPKDIERTAEGSAPRRAPEQPVHRAFAEIDRLRREHDTRMRRFMPDAPRE